VAVLRRDHDDAVRRLSTVLRRSRRVLEDVDRLDVVGVEAGVLAHVHPVDDIKRRDTAEEVHAANDHLRGAAGFAAGNDVHAWNSSSELFLDRRLRLARHVHCTDARNRIRHRPPRLFGVPDVDDDLLEARRDCLEGEVGRHRLPVANRHLLRLRRIADALGPHFVRPGSDAGDGISAVWRGHRAEAGAGHRDADVA
jgi:hypothetical protein